MGGSQKEARVTPFNRILLVEDDALFAETLLDQFRLHDELCVDLAETAHAAHEMIGGQHYDLFIFDVGLPDQDGRDLCRKLRGQNIRQPIIMLTGAASEADTILGLDAGANDYVTKPFKFGELLGRIRAHLRQYEQLEQADLALGPYRFQPGIKLLEHANGEKIRLTEKETAILRHLHRAQGASVSRQDLLTAVWGYDERITTHTLETHIYRLRQKIERDGDPIVVTEAGGYRI